MFYIHSHTHVHSCVLIYTHTHMYTHDNTMDCVINYLTILFPELLHLLIDLYRIPFKTAVMITKDIFIYLAYSSSFTPWQCLRMQGQPIYGGSPVVPILGSPRCSCYCHTRGFSLPLCCLPSIFWAYYLANI